MNFPDLMSLYNMLGDCAFCIGGVLAAKPKTSNRLVLVLCGVASTFFGGAFLRDIAILNTPPVILTSPLEVLAVVLLATLAAIIYPYEPSASHRKSRLAPVLLTADSIGVLIFVAMGYDRGLTLGGGVVSAVACGFSTAAGGGLFSVAFRSAAKKGSRTAKLQDFKNSLRRNIPYYQFCFFTVAAYALLHAFASNTGPDLNITLLMTIPTILGGYWAQRKIAERG